MIADLSRDRDDRYRAKKRHHARESDGEERQFASAEQIALDVVVLAVEVHSEYHQHQQVSAEKYIIYPMLHLFSRPPFFSLCDACGGHAFSDCCAAGAPDRRSRIEKSVSP